MHSRVWPSTSGAHLRNYSWKELFDSTLLWLAISSFFLFKNSSNLSLRCACFVSECLHIFSCFIASLLRTIWQITQTGFGGQLSLDTKPNLMYAGSYLQLNGQYFLPQVLRSFTVLCRCIERSIQTPLFRADHG